MIEFPIPEKLTSLPVAIELGFFFVAVSDFGVCIYCAFYAMLFSMVCCA
jgi:hypothetical protein